MERFTSLWPQIADMARVKSMRISVVGDGQIATALTLGIQQTFAADSLARPSRISLISGANLPLAYSPPKMQSRVLALLKSRGITVLQDRCTQVSEGEATLGCGARLASDATLVALLAPFPTWLLQSGLTKHANGMIDVDAQGQSSSHARVFFAKYQAVNTAGPAGYDLAWRLGHFLDLPPSAKANSAPVNGQSTWLFLPSGHKKAIGCWRKVCINGASMWRAMQSADNLALRRAGLLKD
jgi:NADPH-dependent 2,4-dienoyl-CoA reductase/sulfur reductase-like enzyme